MSFSKSHVRGISTFKATPMGPESLIDRRSAFALARLLGTISPNVSTTKVITTVASGTPQAAPRRTVNIHALKVEAVMFTTLFPINMVDMSLS